QAIVGHARFGTVEYDITVRQHAIREIEVFGAREIATWSEHLVEATRVAQSVAPERDVGTDASVSKLCQLATQTHTPRWVEAHDKAFLCVVRRRNDCSIGHARARILAQRLHDRAQPVR